MGGVDVGIVIARRNTRKTRRIRTIYVTVAIVRAQAERIRKPVYDETGKIIVRKGTVASIVNKGLLGDKMIELSASPSRARRSSPGDDPLKTRGAARSSSGTSRSSRHREEDREGSCRTSKSATGALSDPKFTHDLKGTVKSLHDDHSTASPQGRRRAPVIFDPEEQEADRMRRDPREREVDT